MGVRFLFVIAPEFNISRIAGQAKVMGQKNVCIFSINICIIMSIVAFPATYHAVVWFMGHIITSKIACGKNGGVLLVSSGCYAIQHSYGCQRMIMCPKNTKLTSN